MDEEVLKELIANRLRKAFLNCIVTRVAVNEYEEGRIEWNAEIFRRDNVDLSDQIKGTFHKSSGYILVTEINRTYIYNLLVL